eukprot:307857_1
MDNYCCLFLNVIIYIYGCSGSYDQYETIWFDSMDNCSETWSVNGAVTVSHASVQCTDMPCCRICGSTNGPGVGPEYNGEITHSTYNIAEYKDLMVEFDGADYNIPTD